MEEILQLVLDNLIKVGIGCGLFVIAYCSNILLSLWYNIKIKRQEFESKRLLESLEKILAFGAGTSLLTIGITLVPIFVNEVGLTIPEEYAEVFQDLAVITVFIIAACKYLVEAFTKFQAILTYESGEELNELPFE